MTLVSSAARQQSRLAPDEFLSDVLGFPALRLSGDGEDVSVDDLPSSALVWTKVPTETPGRVEGLLRYGFRLITTEVQLVHRSGGTVRSSSLGGSGSRISVRSAQPADERSVCGIAATAFTEDRFHRDPKVGTDAAERIKRAWVENFFKGQRGDRMLLAEGSDGSVAGFVQLLDLPDATVIDLIAVDPSAQGKGMGRALTEAVLDDSLERSREIRVGTQLTNTRSLQLYTHLGFGIVASSHVLHLHFDPSEVRAR